VRRFAASYLETALYLGCRCDSYPGGASDPVRLAAAPGFAARVGSVALYLDAGSADEYGMDRHVAHLHEALIRAGVAHSYERYPGGHGDRIADRLRISLPWIAARIARPCHPDRSCP
jgi:predicted esterase